MEQVIGIYLMVFLTAVFTVIAVNFGISVYRRHKEHHGRAIEVQDVLRDATDVSCSVRGFIDQLGGT